MKNNIFIDPKGIILRGDSANEARANLRLREEADRIEKLLNENGENEASDEEEFEDAQTGDSEVSTNCQENMDNNRNERKEAKSKESHADQNDENENSENSKHDESQKESESTKEKSNTDDDDTYFDSEPSNVNIGNASAEWVSSSSTSQAQGVSVNAMNASATGATANISAEATGFKSNNLTATATGASASASANATLLKQNAFSASISGIEAAATASATAVSSQVGCVDINGGSVGASVNVTGTGIQAGNISLGGPSAAASVNVSGQLSFGNINFGLRPSLDIGLGFNLGIPFLSGGSMRSGGGGGNGGDEESRNGGTAGNSNGHGGEGNHSNEGGHPGGGGKSNSNSHAGGARAENGGKPNGSQTRGLVNQAVNGLKSAQSYLSNKYPNKSYYHRNEPTPQIRDNREGLEVDPKLDHKKMDRSDICHGCPEDENVVDDHTERLRKGQKYVGIRGTGSESNAAMAKAEGREMPAPSSDNSWAGLYTTNNPEIAASYAPDDKLNPQPINRIYMDKDAAPIYYTQTPLDTPEAKEMLTKIQKVSKGKYVFGGPQSGDHDSNQPEFVTSPKVRDDPKANVQSIPSAHQSTPFGQPKAYHVNEMNNLKIIPDKIVAMRNKPEGFTGREGLAHVFQRTETGRPKNTGQTTGQPNRSSPKNEGHSSEPGKAASSSSAPRSDDAPEDTADIQRLQKILAERGKQLSEWEVQKIRQKIKWLQKRKDGMKGKGGSLGGDKGGGSGDPFVKTGAQSTAAGSEDKKEEEEEGPPVRCTNHAENVRCFKCLIGSKGRKIKLLSGNGSGNVYGFDQ